MTAKFIKLPYSRATLNKVHLGPPVAVTRAKPKAREQPPKPKEEQPPSASRSPDDRSKKVPRR
jgi:hypothetical protein